MMKPRFFYGYIIVAAAFLVLIISWGTNYSFGIFLKPLAAQFGWTRAETSGAYSLSFLVAGVLCIVTGKLTDRFGPRLVVTACGIVLGLGYLLMSRTSALWQLYLFFGVIIGTGMSASFVPLASTVARWFTRRRGMATGILVSGTGIGMLIMPPVANRLITALDWREAYVILGVTALVLIVFAAQFLKRAPRLSDAGNGAGLETVQVSGLTLGQAIQTRRLWLICVAYFGWGVFLQSVLVHLVPHETELGIAATTAASAFIVLGALNAAGRITVGSFSDRVGNRTTMTICFFLTTASLVWLLAARQMWALYLFSGVFGFAEGGLAALQSTLVAELFGLKSHGVVLGFMNFMITVGGAVGPTVTGRIFDITGNYILAFSISAVMSAVGLIIGVVLLLSKREPAYAAS